MLKNVKYKRNCENKSTKLATFWFLSICGGYVKYFTQNHNIIQYPRYTVKPVIEGHPSEVEK